MEHHFEHWMGPGPDFGFSPLMFLGNILWLVLLGLLAWTLIRWFISTVAPHYFDHPDGPAFLPPMEPPALEILRQRYARGEIDGETFDQMRERIEASYHPPRQG
ncbi:MAG TPA: SHOCT domain-containing protein [Ktedonobacteraceae bacterium]|jgi:putative membrane protein|nr:SHOCT domain-containing protein [Ktedonobacteraceae bacterium]